MDRACISWLPTKLEPGPTLITYESLTPATKANWTDTVDALTTSFADETEKETFLADQASFKRGDKSLVQYKNELLRLMKIYLPNLVAVPEEFQWQACTRFMDGLDDEELKRLLRRHCRRTKNNIEEAYTFTVDYESSDIQTKIRDGEASAAFGKKTLAATSASADARPRILRRQNAADSRQYSVPLMAAVDDPIAEEVRGLSAKHKITEMRVQELTAKSAHMNDRIDIVAKEMGQLSVNQTKMEKSMVSMNESMVSRFDRIEQLLLTNNQQTNANQFQGNNFRQFNQNAPRGQYQSRPSRGYQNSGSFRGGGGGFASGGAAGQSANGQVGNAGLPAASNAQGIPVTGNTGVSAPPLLAAIDEVAADCNETEVKRETGWWSPNMMYSEVEGYDEEGGALSYGGEDFCPQ